MKKGLIYLLLLVVSFTGFSQVKDLADQDSVGSATTPTLDNDAYMWIRDPDAAEGSQSRRISLYRLGLEMDVATSVLLTLEDTITSAEILASNSSPIELIAAPGAGRYINVVSAVFSIDYAGTAYTTTSTTGLRYSGGQTIGSSTSFGLESTSDYARLLGSSTIIGINEAVQFYAVSADPESGTSDMKVKILYTIERI